MAQCELDECNRPKYQGHKYCGSHYMKWYRYGDPHYKAPSRARNVTGQRFDQLVAQYRTDAGRWHCKCDCGQTRDVTLNELNRSSAKGRVTCGIKQNHWRSDPGYYAVHDRVRAARGVPAAYECIDCGKTAQEWSYDHTDADEFTNGIYEWSSDLSHYHPRCVLCHRRFDKRHAQRRRAGYHQTGGRSARTGLPPAPGHTANAI